MVQAAVRRAFAVVAVPVVLLATAGAASAVPGDPGDPGEVTRTETYTLTVTPPAAGTITGTGISCPGDCAQDFQEEVTCIGMLCEPTDGEWTTVTLNASRGIGWLPLWTGCGSETGTSCNVDMTDDRTVSVAWNDVLNPTATLSSPPPSGVAGNSMPVGATASDNAGIASVRFLVDGVLKLTDASAPYGGTIDMSDASAYAHGTQHTVSAVAVDMNGRTSDPSRSTITIDRQVSLALSTPMAFTNAATVPVTITTDSDAETECRIVGGAAPVECDDSWSGVDATSPDGSYTYEVKATDQVANVATVTRSFVLDRTAPAVTSFDGPTEGSIVGTDRVTFTFGASDTNLLGVQCKVGSAAAGPCSSATSHELTGLTDGAKTFSLIVTDKAGNQTTRTRTFQVQRPVTNTGSTGGGSTGTTQTQAPSTAGPSGSSSTTRQAGSGGGGPALKVIRAKLKFKKQRRAGRTRLSGLQLTGVPKGARITATCKGKAKKGCPRKAPKAIRKSGTVKLSALAKLKLRKGAVLTIVVSAPGYAPKTLTVRI